jgi:AAA+ ATPase superfamily predicted ATPase
MKFINRREELARLDRMVAGNAGRLAVLYGRRRVGKTRLLVEWAARHGGVYTVADQSSPDVQRRYFAESLSMTFPGFAEVDYPDWPSLLARLAREARAAHWRGPLVIDELPYLALGSPEIARVLQRWIDHEAREAGLKVALAGSSQRMMQGLVLSANAPLYGRAHTSFEVKPLSATELPQAFGARSAIEIVELYTAWGGIPRYWELAADAGGDVFEQVESLVLDPLGPLHSEPDRLLLEELPPAVELRPLLDAIGLGAHRVSEIAGRIGRPATALARALARLQELSLVRREVPFGEHDRNGKRSLYKLDDPFVRLWFRVVAPHRAQLVSGKRAERLRLLRSAWPQLAAAAWEELCCRHVAQLSERAPLARLGAWRPGTRWWQGNQPEWDLVSETEDGKTLLVGEAKWSDKPFQARELERLAREVAARSLPNLAQRNVVRAVFVPVAAPRGPREIAGVHVVTGAQLLTG